MSLELDKLKELFGYPERYESSCELVFRCPECGGSLRVNLIKGVYHCFKCSYKGRVKGDFHLDYKTEYNQKIQKEVANWIYNTCLLDELHYNYLYGRGLEFPWEYGFRTLPVNLKAKLVSEFGLSELQAGGIIDAKGSISRALGCRRIFFPYWNDNEIIGFKTRQSDFADFVNEHSPKYLVLPGTVIHQKPFYYHSLFSDILVTEGELKSLIAGQYGYMCYSLPGISCSKKCLENTKHYLNKTKARKFLVFDREVDSNTHLALIKSTYKVATSLGLCIVVLPLLDKEKTGLDDFLIKTDDLDYLLEEAWDKRQYTYEYFKRAAKN